MANPGLLLIMSGPSGAGKGRLRSELTRRQPDLYYGISVTTRKMRPGEIEGKSYFFVSHDAFKRLIDSNGLVEWAEVYGNYYGTPRQPMEDYIASGRDVIIEKDIQGALALKKVYPEAAFIFVMPPSLEELRRRIQLRGTENEKARNQRLASASEELTYIDSYDYVIVNDDLMTAVDQLEAVLIAEKVKVCRQPNLIEKYKRGAVRADSEQPAP